MTYKRLLQILQVIDLAMRELTYVKDKTETPPPSGGYKEINASVIADVAIQYGRSTKIRRDEVLQVLNTPLAKLIEVYK
jgi:hypothetical protein